MKAVKALSPYMIGTVIAVIIAIYPDARPIACGLGFALPFTVSE